MFLQKKKGQNRIKVGHKADEKSHIHKLREGEAGSSASKVNYFRRPNERPGKGRRGGKPVHGGTDAQWSLYKAIFARGENTRVHKYGISRGFSLLGFSMGYPAMPL